MILSADSYVVEPPKLRIGRMPTEYRHRALRLVRGPECDQLVCEDAVISPIGLAAGDLRPVGPIGRTLLSERRRGVPSTGRALEKQ
jgi:hypothetical protein